MPTPDFIWTVRAHIYAHFVATARAPLAADLARHFGLPLAEMEAVLTALDAQHALFLEPGTHTIRIANPFSAIPTNFEVEAMGRVYWANCAWDAFGIPAALHAPEAVIRAQCAHSGAPLTLRLAGGEAQGADEVIHFLVPFDRWYEDMVFTWGTIRFFRSEDDLRAWQANRHDQSGEYLRPARVWALAQHWYHNRLSPSYRSRTVAEAQAIFTALGLTSAFWQPPGMPEGPQK